MGSQIVVVRASALLDGAQHCQCKESAESLERGLLGRDVAFSGSLGFCDLKCPEEVWAAWRALLLPHKERTSRPQGDGGL